MTPLLASLLTILTVAAILFATALVLRWIRNIDMRIDLGGSADAMRDHTPDEINRPIGIGGAADREGR